MTVLAARGESLREASIRKFLDCAVNPSEAQCLFNDIKVGKYSRLGSLGTAYNDPALLLLEVILL